MATIDISTPVGRVRAAVGDFDDIPTLSDTVISAVLTQYGNSEPQAIKQCAMYILAALSREGHQRMDKLEVFGSEAFNNYLKFIKEVIKDPTSAYNNFLPYCAGMRVEDVTTNSKDVTLVHQYVPNYNLDSQYSAPKDALFGNF